MSEADSNAPTVGSRTLRGVVWAYGSYAGGRLLVLLSTAVLARVLTPDEFGVVALAIVFTAFLETVRELGVTQAVVIAPEDEVEEWAQTAWRFSVSLGTAVALLVAALAPLAASFFDEPRLTGLMMVLGLNFPLRALGSTHYALAQRALDFRTRTVAEFSDVVVRGGLGIALALAGFGAWSLVLGYVAGTLALVTALWLRMAWRPRFGHARAPVRRLIGFGGTVTAVDLVHALIAYVDNFFCGRELGTRALGIYTLAFRLPSLMVENLAIVAAQALFPAFATVDRDQLARAYLVALRYTLTVVVPMAVPLALLAEPVLVVAFGDQWRGGATAMAVLTTYMAASTITIPAGVIFKATGRAGLLLRLAVPRLILLVVALAIFADEGIVAIALCQLGGAVALMLANLVLASKQLRVGAVAIAKAVSAPLLAGAAMAGAVLLASEPIGGDLLKVLAGSLAGLAAYAAGMLLLARDTIDDALRKLGRA